MNKLRKYFDNEKFIIFEYSILLTSFVIALRLIGKSYSFVNIEIILYYVEVGFFILWGAIIGLNCKKNIQFIFIKKAFSILLLAMIWISLFGVLIFVDAELIDKFGLFVGCLRSLIMLVVIIPVLIGPFVCGYIIARIVHFFIHN